MDRREMVCKQEAVAMTGETKMDRATLKLSSTRRPMTAMARLVVDIPEAHLSRSMDMASNKDMAADTDSNHHRRGNTAHLATTARQAVIRRKAATLNKAAILSKAATLNRVAIPSRVSIPLLASKVDMGSRAATAEGMGADTRSWL